jgi:hypothetical protein
MTAKIIFKMKKQLAKTLGITEQVTRFMTLILVFCLLMSEAVTAQGHFKIRNDGFIQIGYDSYKTLSFGSGGGTPNNGRFAIEYWSGGLNFWKPWPTTNASNFNLFLRDDGNAAIGSSGDANFKLVVNGKIRATEFIINSDSRLKSNILPIQGALEKIISLKPVTYRYNYEFEKYKVDKNGLSDAKLRTMSNDSMIKSTPNDRIGLIAQDVETVLRTFHKNSIIYYRIISNVSFKGN